jgi:hypothetical protein
LVAFFPRSSSFSSLFLLSAHTLISSQFYHDTLFPSASSSIQTSPLRFYSALPQPGFPLLFQHLSGHDLEVDDGASFYNDAEVQAVKEHVVALVRPQGADNERIGVVKPKEISVIAPFREQVWRIRLALRAVGLGEVDVGNVEALQGAEKCVFSSSFPPFCPRTNSPIRSQPSRHHLSRPLERTSLAPHRPRSKPGSPLRAETVRLQLPFSLFCSS